MNWWGDKKADTELIYSMHQYVNMCSMISLWRLHIFSLPGHDEDYKNKKQKRNLWMLTSVKETHEC